MVFETKSPFIVLNDSSLIIREAKNALSGLVSEEVLSSFIIHLGRLVDRWSEDDNSGVRKFTIDGFVNVFTMQIILSASDGNLFILKEMINRVSSFYSIVDDRYSSRTEKNFALRIIEKKLKEKVEDIYSSRRNLAPAS